MKKQIYIVFIAIAMTGSCKKTEQDIAAPGTATEQTQSDSFPISEAKAWTARQDTGMTKLNPNWTAARKLNQKDAWLIPVPGAPIFQKVKQGKRKLLISKDSTGTIKARILEIIPDAHTLQQFGSMPKDKFSGRILIYTPDHQLESGKLFSSGKISGEIKNAKYSASKLLSMKGAYTHPDAVSRMVQQAISIYETCSWWDSAYIDGDGIFTIHSERLCSYTIIDDSYYYGDYGGGGYFGPSDYYDQPSPGGGGYQPQPDPDPIPPSSNLPGEEQQTVDPKKMMECFTALAANPNANFQVKIHVQEPFPGTSFNIGPNSVGHVAMELTVTSGNQSISQVVGFYPQATSGTQRMSGPSRIVDNSDLEYNVSATFYVSQGNFHKITNFITNAPDGYDFLTYNCTAFVYNAATLGGIDIPMGYTTVGLSGPGGATVAQTPAGLGSELRSMKANNPNINISTAGGRARESKGECQ
ncbi:MAG: hypothetical protein V4594_20250 [Bacteroidota bacterium]